MKGLVLALWTCSELVAAGDGGDVTYFAMLWEGSKAWLIYEA